MDQNDQNTSFHQEEVTSEADTEERNPSVKHSKMPVIAVIVLALIALSFYIIWQYAFRVEVIRVFGVDSAADIEYVINESGISTGENMFMVQESDVQKSIEKKHDFVFVAMEKDFGTRTVYLQVRKRVAVARLDKFNTFYLMDIDCMVMQKVQGDEGDAYPIITGLQSGSIHVGRVLSGIQQAQLTAYQAIMNSILPSDHIAKINLSDTDNLKAETQDGYYLIFGDSSNMTAKIRAYRIVHAYFKQTGTKGTIYLNNPEDVLISPDGDNFVN